MFETPQAPVTPPADASPAPVVAPVEPVVAPVAQDPNSLFAPQLQAIVNPQGQQKYADVNTALASIPHAQGHIDTLTAQVAQLEEQVAKSKGMDEVLQRLESNQQPPAVTPVSGLDETSVNALVERQLANREQASLAKLNQDSVVSSLQGSYGDKAEEVFNAKAASLGMSVEQLNQLSAQSPSAVKAFFTDIPAPVQNPTLPGSTTPLQVPAGAEDKSYMDIFGGGKSAAISKWQAAAAKP